MRRTRLNISTMTAATCAGVIDLGLVCCSPSRTHTLTLLCVDLTGGFVVGGGELQ